MADQELLALVKRLEAVATRLEGSAPGGETSALLKQVSSMSSSGLSQDGLQALAKAVEAVEAAGMRNGTSNNTTSAGPTSASLVAFDDILNGPFKTFLELSKKNWK